MIFGFGFLKFDLSLKSCRRARQAQFRNQESIIIKRKSVANRVAHLIKRQGPGFILPIEQSCESRLPATMRAAPGLHCGRFCL
jgi:hypothetical protein